MCGIEPPGRLTKMLLIVIKSHLMNSNRKCNAISFNLYQTSQSHILKRNPIQSHQINSSFTFNLKKFSLISKKNPPIIIQKILIQKTLKKSFQTHLLPGEIDGTRSARSHSLLILTIVNGVHDLHGEFAAAHRRGRAVRPHFGVGDLGGGGGCFVFYFVVWFV